MGFKANQLLIQETPELKIDEYYNLFVDKESVQTSLKKVFLEEAILSAEGIVIEIMGMAKSRSFYY